MRDKDLLVNQEDRILRKKDAPGDSLSCCHLSPPRGEADRSLDKTAHDCAIHSKPSFHTLNAMKD